MRLNLEIHPSWFDWKWFVVYFDKGGKDKGEELIFGEDTDPTTGEGLFAKDEFIPKTEWDHLLE